MRTITVTIVIDLIQCCPLQLQDGGKHLLDGMLVTTRSPMSLGNNHVYWSLYLVNGKLRRHLNMDFYGILSISKFPKIIFPKHISNFGDPSST